MFVVRRSFRNNGQIMLPGSFVEPSSIKRFKTRLKDRYIVEVSAHNFAQWNAYFVGKFGVALECVNTAEATEEATEEAPAKLTVKVVAAVKK